MTEFETEGRGCPSAALGCQQLRQAMESGRILENRARAFDAQKQLRFRFADCEGVMPYEECADGIREGTVRPIAVLTRVGRQVCFVVTGFTEGPSGPVALLSRARAQRACREQYLSRLVPGDIIPCTVTHIEPFGAFCDVGCGIAALLPIDCLSVSRIASPADRVRDGSSGAELSDTAAEDLRRLDEAVREGFRCTPCASCYRVGAVIVLPDGRTFRGYTHETSPTHHAEQEAVAKALAAGANLHGATIYSSMEPCSQRSSEPESCTQLILRCGFARVVFACYEPDRFVHCQGARTLREARIDVRAYPELAHDVQEANAHLGR